MRERYVPITESMIRIGDLSRATGVPIATLRYYESEGLIHCLRTRTKYRMFDRGTIDQVKQILYLKGLKFPLQEIRQILASSAGHSSLEDYLLLKERLAHVLEQKALWEDQEARVRLQLESFPPEIVAAAEERGGQQNV